MVQFYHITNIENSFNYVQIPIVFGFFGTEIPISWHANMIHFIQLSINRNKSFGDFTIIVDEDDKLTIKSI